MLIPGDKFWSFWKVHGDLLIFSPQILKKKKKKPAAFLKLYFSLWIVPSLNCKSSHFIVVQHLNSLELCKNFLFGMKEYGFQTMSGNHILTIYTCSNETQTSLDFLFLILWILICVFSLWVNWEAFSFCELSTFLQNHRIPLLIGLMTITTLACR